MTKPLKYTDKVDAAWSANAVHTFQVTSIPDSDPIVLDLDGRCPRCQDAMQDRHWLIAFSGVSSMTLDSAVQAREALRKTGVMDGPLLPAEFSVQCCCKIKHPDPLGRTGLSGCGAIWRMRFETVDEDVG